MTEIIDATPSVESAPVESVDSAVETVETPEPEQAEAETTSLETPDGTPSTPAGVSPQVSQYIKDLKATDPKAAQELERAVYGWNQFRKSYPEGIKGIQKMAQIVEQVGGAEGVQAIEAERAEWNALDEKFTKGDPEFVTAIAESDPQAFLKIVPYAINQFAKIAPEQYDHLMAGVVFDTAGPLLKAVYDALPNDEKSQAIAAQIAQWYNHFYNLKSTKPQPKIDPERERLNTERQEFEQQKIQAVHQSISQQMDDYSGRLVEGLIAKEFARTGKNWAQFKAKDAGSANVLVRNCFAELSKISEDPENKLASQYKLLVESGAKSRALQLLKSRMDTYAPKAVTRTIKAFGAFGLGQKNGQQPVAERTVSQEERFLPKMPDRKDIDWNRTTNDMVLSGKAFLKNQKQMVRFG